MQFHIIPSTSDIHISASNYLKGFEELRTKTDLNFLQAIAKVASYILTFGILPAIAAAISYATKERKVVNLTQRSEDTLPPVVYFRPYLTDSSAVQSPNASPLARNFHVLSPPSPNAPPEIALAAPSIAPNMDTAANQAITQVQPKTQAKEHAESKDMSQTSPDASIKDLPNADVVALPSDIETMIEAWQQFREEAIHEKICMEAVKILIENPDQNICKKLLTALQKYKFDYKQKMMIYSAIARSPVPSNQISKLERPDFTYVEFYEICTHMRTNTANNHVLKYEDFLQTHTILLANGERMILPRVLLPLFGDYFDNLLRSGLAEASKGEIVLADLTKEEFDIIVNPMKYDLNDPNTWLLATSLADRFQNQYMLNKLPKYPKFSSPENAIEWAAESKWPVLDLSQFKDNINDTHLALIRERCGAGAGSNKQPSLSHLQTIVIRSLNITDASINTLPERLEELDVSGCQKLTNAMTKNLPKGLKRLNVSYCNLTDASIKDLPNGLRMLDVSGCTLMTGASTKDLPRGLTTLNMSYRPNLTNLAVKDLPVGLKVLDVSACTNLTDAFIESLPNGVETLNISMCSNLTDAMIKKLPRGLKVLDVRGCDNLTGALIDDLPEGLIGLGVNPNGLRCHMSVVDSDDVDGD